ncbi:MAG: 16S rRNA (guanine(527)-N(7))-methyltransferase RsmG [Bryobacteraceae bacterium]
MMFDVQFDEALARVLPLDIPHRERLIEKTAQHLMLIASVNKHMNLTRITDPQQAAIKHVYDSVVAWRHFQGAKKVLDAGTGAGFPGIPLSLVLPHVRFTLAESVQKKARFVDSVVESLELPNVHVVAQRAEERAASRHPDIITARAMAPIPRIIDLFGKALKEGARLILYKGPDVEAELEDAEKKRLAADVLCRYELPDGLGQRTLIQIQRHRLARTAS